MPLIALLLSYDAIVGEFERGTMVLLLAYPVARWQVMLGKFLGQWRSSPSPPCSATAPPGWRLAATRRSTPESWRAFAAMIGSSVLLGAAFVAIGYLISTVVRDRGTAGGIAVGVWLLFVLLYDMALLGALVADQGRIDRAGVLNLLLLLNPADAYRLLNLTGFANVSLFAGMAGLAGQVQFGGTALLGMLAAWIAAPLALAAVIFSRKQI